MTAIPYIVLTLLTALLSLAHAQDVYVEECSDPQPYDAASGDVSDGYAFLPDSDESMLRVYDLSLRRNAVHAGEAKTAGTPLAVAVEGDFAYVTNGRGGYPLQGDSLQVFDVSEPASPVAIGKADAGWTPTSVVIRGSYAYVIAYDGFLLQTFDISTPSKPSLVHAVGTAHNPTDIAIRGDRMYVVHYENGEMQVFDLSDPSKPTFDAEYRVKGNLAISIAIHDDLAYVVTSEGTEVYDVSKPTPVYVRTIEGEEPAPEAFDAVETLLRSTCFPLPPEPANSPAPSSFSDVPPDSWFASYVRGAAEAGIVSGYRNPDGTPTGTFGPGQPVTIAEALKISLKSAGFEPVANCPTCLAAQYPDHWAAEYVNAAEARDIDDWVLAPPAAEPREPSWPYVNPWDQHDLVDLDRPATRAEVAAMVVLAFGWSWGDTFLPDPAFFSDVPEDHRLKRFIDALANEGVVWGDVDADGEALGTFRPSDTINRAEMVKIAVLARALQQREQADRKDELVLYGEDGFSPSTIVVDGPALVYFYESSRPDWKEGTRLWLEADGYPGLSYEFHPTAWWGRSFRFLFAREGTWTYRNRLHPEHEATIVVR